MAGAVHPAEHHLGGRALAAGDVLPHGAVPRAGGGGPVPGRAAVGGGVGVEVAGHHVGAVALRRRGERAVGGELRQAVRGALPVGQREDLTGGALQARRAERPGPQGGPVHLAGAGVRDPGQSRLLEPGVAQGAAGPFAGQAVVHERARVAGAGDQVLADGQIGVPGGDDALVHGDAVRALGAEQPARRHAGGVGPRRGHEPRVEGDRRGAGGGARGVHRVQELPGVGSVGGGRTAARGDRTEIRQGRGPAAGGRRSDRVRRPSRGGWRARGRRTGFGVLGHLDAEVPCDTGQSVRVALSEGAEFPGRAPPVQLGEQQHRLRLGAGRGEAGDLPAVRGC